MSIPEFGCTCGNDIQIISDGLDPLCPTHGLDLSTVEDFAMALRFAGVEIGSVGGENVRAHYAARLLPLVEAKFATVWAEAYALGINDERDSQEHTGGQAGPNRNNPYDKTRTRA